MKKVFQLVLSLLMCLTLVGCGGSNSNDPNDGSKTSRKEFDKFVASIPPKVVSSDNSVLTQLLDDKEKAGFKNELYEWEVPSLKQAKKDAKTYSKLYDELVDYKRSSLSESQQLTYDVLEASFEESEIEVSDKASFYLSNNPLGKYSGVLMDLPLNFTILDFKNQNDVDSYIHLLETFDTYMTDLVEFEKERQNAGYGLSKAEIQKDIEICDDIINADMAWLTKDFNAKIDSITFEISEDKEALKNKVKEYSETKFKQGFKNLKDELSKLESQTSDKKTIADMKDGKEYYEQLVCDYTGFKDIKSYKKWLDKKFRINESTFLDPYSGEVMQDASMKVSQYQGSQDLDSLTITNSAKDPNGVLALLKSKMDNDFPTTTDVKYNMEILPSELKTLFDGVGAFYLPSAVDNKNTQEKMMLIHDYEQTDFDTIAHEGYPGHMYQHTYYKTVDHPLIRDFLDFKGYTEGYANYVQRLSSKYADDVQAAEYYEANQNVTYFAILQIDYTLNYEGDYDKACEIVGELFGEENTKELIQQLQWSPGAFVCYYASGYRINDLKDSIQKDDSGVSDKDFNEALLKVGPAPYKVFKKWVKTYLK